MKKICSKEARKVLDGYPMLDRFCVERMLHKCSPAVAMRLLGKHGTDDKAIAKIVAMLSNGYCKNVKRDIDVDWDKVMFHYYHLTCTYLDEDFSYNDIAALVDISQYSFTFIDKHVQGVRVKNLWYLRKVLMNAADRDITDATTYKHIDQVNVNDVSDKGAKVDADHLKEYVG